jgi:hypothetical protein
VIQLQKYKNHILALLATLTFILGVIGFSISEESTGLEVLNHTLGLYVMEWVDHEDSWILDLATLFGALTFFLAVIKIFFSKIYHTWRKFIIPTKSYNVVVGLSEQNVSLLKSNEKDLSTIIIEKDKNHPHINSFKEKGFVVIEGHTKEAIKNLDLSNMERCFISTGNDRKNIALGKLIMKQIEDKKRHTVHVCIENRDLNILFKQEVISLDKKKEVIISTYSLYENIVKNLFSKHSILGEYSHIINNKEEFSIVIVGDSDLAIELVYHISFLSTLPNQNSLNLYLVGANAKAFHKRVKKTFPKIEKIPHLTLIPKELNSESLDFYIYENEMWNSKKLTNIFIATKDEEKNLDIAINLQDTTFIKEIGHNRFKSRVLFALYHNRGLGEEIDTDKDAFANFHTFGNIQENSTKEILIDEKLDKISKLILSNHKDKKDSLITELDHSWIETLIHQQESNKTQALHLDIKLLAFGFTRNISLKSVDELLEINNKKFYSKLEESEKIKKQLKSYKKEYFPSSFDTTLLDKVARSEHNRWSAFQYLNGWDYHIIRENDAKEHNCLIPLEEFNDEIKHTYQYDLASVYFIPIYLARAGFEMLEVE